MISVFQRRETVPIWAYFKDWEGVYTTPDNGVKVTLTDPDGTVQVDAQAMDENSTGKFLYYYTTVIGSAKGWWRYYCLSQDGLGATARYTLTYGGFQLQ